MYLLLIVAAVPIISTYLVAVDSETESSEVIVTVLITIVVSSLILGLLFLAKLEVYLENNGIIYRYFPFQIKYKLLPYDDIAEFKARKYSPIIEYGGWGIRYAFKHGWAYNVSGNMGVQIIKKDGKKLLFGSQKHTEFELSLNTIMKNRKQGF